MEPNNKYMKYDLLGLYIEEFSIRNKNLENQNVYSVTNSEGFIRSTDFLIKWSLVRILQTIRLFYRTILLITRLG